MKVKGNRPGKEFEGKMVENENTVPPVGDQVRSIHHGTIGYLHHINDDGKAWVSDEPNGRSGNYFDLVDLVKK
jgi:hypothetical protein